MTPSKTMRLALYRHARQPGEVELPPVLAIIEGHVRDVRCDICGATRTWIPCGAVQSTKLAIGG